MKIVYWQRYPEDDVSSRIFDDDGEAMSFLLAKQEDYRYTVGKVWMKTVNVVD